MGSSFREKEWFSKLQYLAIKLSHCKKFQQWHIYSLSTPEGRNWAYFCSTCSGFWDTGRFSKLPYMGMKLANGQRSRSCSYMSSFYLRGSNLSLYLFYRQRFPRYGPIFKIALFGHETWQVAKVPEVAHITFLPQGVEIDLMLALQAEVSEI